MPQDVHPQAYQSGVGVPPGPQWGAAAPQGGPPHAAHPPQGRVADWARGASEYQNSAQQSQPVNPFDQQEPIRAPHRLLSPRQEPPRLYSDQARNTPARKPMSPSPKMNPAVPNMYPPGGHLLPQINGSDRNHQGFSPGARAPIQPNGTSVNGTHLPASHGPLPPYGRPFSPPTELRPLRDERPQSPRPNLSQQQPPPPQMPPQQQHQQGQPLQAQQPPQAQAPQQLQAQQQPPPPPFNQSQAFPGTSSMAGGGAAPPPLPLQTHQVSDGMPRDIHDRPPSVKRHRDWEAESGPSKKAANEENRARLEENTPRRTSPPGRVATPGSSHRRSSSEIRKENQRIADQNYHPSEAAHHTAPLAAASAQSQSSHVGLQTPQTPHVQQNPSRASNFDTVKEERKELTEGPARKVQVDENYDDDGEDEKAAVVASAISSRSGQPSPRGLASATAQAKPESISA